MLPTIRGTQCHIRIRREEQSGYAGGMLFGEVNAKCCLMASDNIPDGTEEWMMGETCHSLSWKQVNSGVLYRSNT